MLQKTANSSLLVYVMQLETTQCAIIAIYPLRNRICGIRPDQTRPKFKFIEF